MLQKVRHFTHLNRTSLILNVLQIAFPKPRWIKRQHETNIKPTPCITLRCRCGHCHHVLAAYSASHVAAVDEGWAD